MVVALFGTGMFFSKKPESVFLGFNFRSFSGFYEVKFMTFQSVLFELIDNWHDAHQCLFDFSVKYSR